MLHPVVKLLAQVYLSPSLGAARGGRRPTAPSIVGTALANTLSAARVSAE
jgi:hypothetical protein